MFVEHLATGIAHGCSLYGGNGGIDGGNWYMAGGNYAMICDSRYSEFTGLDYPISIHDRKE